MAEGQEKKSPRRFLVKVKPEVTMQELALIFNMMPIIVDESNKSRLENSPNIKLIEIPDVISKKLI